MTNADIPPTSKKKKKHKKSPALKIKFWLVSGTKMDDKFRQGQFVTDGFSAPYRLDLNCLGGGLMLFVREDILTEKPTESKVFLLN